jgi:hypothetical protein
VQIIRGTPADFESSSKLWRELDIVVLGCEYQDSHTTKKIDEAGIAATPRKSVTIL